MGSVVGRFEGRRPLHVLALALAAATLVACGDDPVAVEFEVIEEVEFDPSLNIDLEQMTQVSGGVYIQDLTVGTAPFAAPGDHLSLNYTGWLRTGVEFDSGQLDFQYLVDPFIVGFEVGISGMGVGGVRKIVIPPAAAYGSIGSGPIPPGAIVIFQVEMLSVT